jgi:hypothetical protein
MVCRKPARLTGCPRQSWLPKYQMVNSSYSSRGPTSCTGECTGDGYSSQVDVSKSNSSMQGPVCQSSYSRRHEPMSSFHMCHQFLQSHAIIKLIYLLSVVLPFFDVDSRCAKIRGRLPYQRRQCHGGMAGGRAVLTAERLFTGVEARRLKSGLQMYLAQSLSDSETMIKQDAMERCSTNTFDHSDDKRAQGCGPLLVLMLSHECPSQRCQRLKSKCHLQESCRDGGRLVSAASASL